MVSPFVLTVYDKAFRRKGSIGDPAAVTVTARHNVMATATVTLASDHHRLPNLLADGARMTVGYDGKQILSGPVRRVRGRSGQAGTVDVDVDDDWRLLQRILGWPVPTAALSSQTLAYDVRTGPAESVLKAYVAANATRLGLPVTVAADQARGGTITGSLRFHPLADRLFPAVDQAGVGVTVKQSGSGLIVDCYIPTTHPRTLTEASGVVQSWEYSKAGPSVTRAVVGDQGEATARVFTGSTDAARESAFADVVEVFGDARDTNDAAIVAKRLAELLADGAPKAGLKVELAETDVFRYGRAVTVGDRVTIAVGGGITITDVLREAVLSWTADAGLTVKPAIGERTDDPDTMLARMIAATARGVRRLERR